MLYVDSWAWVIFSHRQIPSEKSLQHHSWLHPLFFNPKIKKSIFSGQTSQDDHRFASLIFPKRKLGFIPAKCASPRAEAEFVSRAVRYAVDIFRISELSHELPVFWPSQLLPPIIFFGREFFWHKMETVSPSFRNKKSLHSAMVESIVHIWPSLYRKRLCSSWMPPKKTGTWKMGCFTNKNICKKMLGFWGYQELTCKKFKCWNQQNPENLCQWQLFTEFSSFF